MVGLGSALTGPAHTAVIAVGVPTDCRLPCKHATAEEVNNACSRSTIRENATATRPRVDLVAYGSGLARRAISP